MDTTKQRPSLSAKFIAELEEVFSSDTLFFHPEEIEKFSRDQTEDLVFPPEVVVKPNTVEEVSRLMQCCNRHGVPVTPVAARTGLSGGALCVNGGVALSMERFNRILSIDENNGQVLTEPAVITQVLMEECAKKGWYYAPDPASRGSCSIGGNIAENSGGPRAVKYGVTKDFVLNLEVVLPSGKVIWTGANTLKNATGYNLTQLMVGSEGTLGVMTKAVLKLLPLPKHNLLMLVPFSSAEKACEAVSAIFKAGITPSALEFMERDAIIHTLQYVPDVQLPVGPDVQAHLLVEVDGNHLEILMKDCELITEVLTQFDCGEILFAEDNAQKNQLWKLRRKAGEAVKAHSVYKEEDTVVPRYELPRLLKGVKVIGKKYGFRSVCYGHAGDGNLHVNILKDDLSDEEWTSQLPEAIREIFELTVSLGGTLSGEHGIGWVQKNYMDIAFPHLQIELMHSIKAIFDPNNILNPGKIFPDKVTV
ncbi:MAG: FAD-binding protein [Crocinitomicaceae bacterium]|nr:FAD-binding protein [Crocinitomicaceae bacterium]